LRSELRMRAILTFLLSCLPALAQVTKPVQVYSTSGQLQWPPSFFMTNVFASGGTTLSFDSLGRMTISSASGSGTNTYYTTNGVLLGQAGTLNFTAGLTGYVSGSEIFVGNSVAGGGDVTTAQLLVVSNQMIASSNYSFTAIGVSSNKFQTDVTNLQGATNGLHARVGNLEGATNGLAAQILAVSNITIVASNKFNTDVSNLQGATNSFNTTNANLANHINNVATNTIKWLTNIWGDVARGFGGLANNQVLTYDSSSGTWTNKTPSAGSGSPGGNAGAIQFNQSGAFEGTNDLYYDRTNGMGYLSGLTPSWTIYKLGSGVSTVRVESGQIQLLSPSADPQLNIAVRNAAGGISGGLNINTNRVTGALSNHMSLGSPSVFWNTSHINYAVAYQAMQLGGTNGGSSTIFSNNGIFRPTNVFVFNVTNPIAGQVFKFHSVTYNGNGSALIALTNDVDNSGGGGGGFIGIDSTTSNIIHQSSATNTTNVVIEQRIGQLVPSFVYRDSNGVSLIEIDNKGFINISRNIMDFNKLAPTNYHTIGLDSYAGRELLESWGDQGISTAYQPSFFNNRITMFQPSATTVIGSYGLTIPVNLGGVTVSHPPPTEQWPYAVQLATPATSNACAGTFSSIDMTTMGTRFGFNGYFFATEFLSTNRLVQHTLTAPVGNRLFIGRTSTANPALTNIVNTTNATGQYAGLYCDSGWTNQFFLSVRDGTAEFRTNTGIYFVATNLYQFYMFQAPTSKFLGWKLKDMTSNTTASGWFSNNVPTNMMKFGYLIRNGTTVVNSVRFSKIYVEAPLSP